VRQEGGKYFIRTENAAAPPTPSKPMPAPNRPPVLPNSDEEGTIQGKLIPPPEDATIAAKLLLKPRPTPRNSSPRPPQPKSISQAPPPVPATAPRKGRLTLKLWLMLVLGIVALGGLATGGFLLFRGKANPSADTVILGKYGGIEIGSTGVKMIAIEYYKDSEGVSYRLLPIPTVLGPRIGMDVNPDIGKLPKGASEFEPKAFQDTVNQVGFYYEKLRDIGLSKENIYIVCSSGVLLMFDTEEVKTRNRERLVKAIRDKTKTDTDPEFIDARDEVRYSILSSVKPADLPKAVLIDIGGNNIKGGGYDEQGNFVDFTVDVGGSSFTKMVENESKRSGEKFVDAARRLRAPSVEEKLHKIKWVEYLRKRKIVHMIGGVSWALAVYTRSQEFYDPGKYDHPKYHHQLFSEDFQKFDEMVCTKDPSKIKEDVLKSLEGRGEWVEVAKENLAKVQDIVFRKREKIISGAQILLAIHKEFDLGARDKTIIGNTYGHFAWLAGYVGERSGHMK
jgi:hypothetical protein